MIIQTIDSNDFERAFHNMGRSNDFNNNSLKVLFDYLEEVYDGSTWELDVIALCCDFSEYSMEELNSNYNSDGEYTTNEELIDYLRDNTTVLEVDADTFIVQCF